MNSSWWLALEIWDAIKYLQFFWYKVNDKKHYKWMCGCDDDLIKNKR